MGGKAILARRDSALLVEAGHANHVGNSSAVLSPVKSGAATTVTKIPNGVNALGLIGSSDRADLEIRRAVGPGFHLSTLRLPNTMAGSGRRILAALVVVVPVLEWTVVAVPGSLVRVLGHTDLELRMPVPATRARPIAGALTRCGATIRKASGPGRPVEVVSWTRRVGRCCRCCRRRGGRCLAALIVSVPTAKFAVSAIGLGVGGSRVVLGYAGVVFVVPVPVAGAAPIAWTLVVRRRPAVGKTARLSWVEEMAGRAAGGVALLDRRWHSSHQRRRAEGSKCEDGRLHGVVVNEGQLWASRASGGA